MPKDKDPTIPKPRQIRLSFPDAAVEQMNAQLKLAVLPDNEPFSDAGWDLGTDLLWLKSVKRQWEEDFSYTELNAEINKWPNYMCRFEEEDVDLHFVHVRSEEPNAIPLILLHGWPGTFYDFHKVIEPLTKPTSPHTPAFHVVVPSLPGYFLSTYPRRPGFTLIDIALLYHKLMVRVLGYRRFFGQGGDWGSWILRLLVAMPDTCHNVRLAHFNMFPAPEAGAVRLVSNLKAAVPSFLDSIPGVTAVKDFVERAALSLVLTSGELHGLNRHRGILPCGTGYSAIQSTKPLTIGYALQASPVALLAYIGEKLHEWSDTQSADWDVNDVIATVVLYHLSKSFATSTLMYHQSKTIREAIASQRGAWQASKDCLLGFTVFPYEIGVAPRANIAAVGNLVFYREQKTGGHFPALDNPAGLVEDIRAFASLHWHR